MQGSVRIGRASIQHLYDSGLGSQNLYKMSLRNCCQHLYICGTETKAQGSVENLICGGGAEALSIKTRSTLYSASMEAHSLDASSPFLEGHARNGGRRHRKALGNV
jgi:hypothetical protein